MAPKKQDAANTTGVPNATSKKSDSRPVVRRVHQGGGKAKLDKQGHLQPGQ